MSLFDRIYNSRIKYCCSSLAIFATNFKRHIGSSFAATSMPIREMDGHTYFETNN